MIHPREAALTERSCNSSDSCHTFERACAQQVEQRMPLQVGTLVSRLPQPKATRGPLFPTTCSRSTLYVSSAPVADTNRSPPAVAAAAAVVCPRPCAEPHWRAAAVR